MKRLKKLVGAVFRFIGDVVRAIFMQPPGQEHFEAAKLRAYRLGARFF